MEDIIDIIVTETTNTIEITAQPNDQIIDVNIIDNREDIVLNVTPTVVEININSLTGNFGVAWGQITGTLSNQTDLNTALGLKADLVAGKVPSSQLPSYVDDVVEVANYAALPATGETGKIYVTIDTNYIYRWTGSVYVEIKDSSAVWGAITGTLSFQNDLQSALNAKFDDPTGDTTQYIAGDGSLITFPVAGQAGTLVREVRNTTGATLTKGTIVYISGATGNKPTVSKALATGDSTSAQTFGMCQANISNNSNGYVVCVGDLTGLDTSAFSEGNQLYLSSTTAGTYTTTKQLAPAHLVYIGVVTRSHPTLGQIEVKIQNGYELDEIHDVAISSVANNEGIFYESSTSLWKNKSIATVLGYTPEQPITFNTPLSRSTNTVSIPAATSSANGYLTSTDWSTFNGKQTALNGTGFVKASGTTISYDNSTYALDSAVVKLAGSQTITGQKTFSSTLYGTSGVFSGQISATTGNINGDNTTNALYITHNSSFNSLVIVQSGGGAAIYADGKILANQFVKIGGASTSFLKADGSVDNNTYLTTSSASSTYLPLSGGTMTGEIVGTTATFTNAGSGIGLGVTLSGASGDGIKITHSAGRAFNIQSSGSGYGVLINNETASTSAPFTIQKQGANKITFSDLGAGIFASGLTAETLDLSNASASNALRINHTNTSYHAVSITATGGSALYATGSVTVIGTLLATGVLTAQSGLANGSGQSFTLPSSTGTLALTSQLSAYLPLAGGTLAGALSGTSATFSGAVTLSNGELQSSTTLKLAANNTTIYLRPKGANDSTNQVSIDNSGAATFSSSVQTTNIGIGYAPQSNIGAFIYRNAADYALAVQQDGSGIPFQVTSGGSVRFLVTNAGNVGIGTTSPTGKLDISNSGDAYVNILSSNANTSTVLSMYNSSGTTDGAAIGYNTAMRFGTVTGANAAGFTERMRITSGGVVYVNQTSASAASLSAITLQVKNEFISTGSNAGIFWENRSGGVTVNSNWYGWYATSGTIFLYNGSANAASINPSTGIYTPLSDKNKKKDFEVSNIGLSEVMLLKPTLYRMKSDESEGQKELGFIAQDVKSVIPNAYVESDGFIGLNFNPIVAALTKAVQELKAELDTYTGKNK